MAKIKTGAKQVLFKVLTFLGIPAFFSFLGCNLFNQPGEYVCEYGMPINYFNFDGIVLGDIDGDEIEEKIPDIKITVKTYLSEQEKNLQEEFYDDISIEDLQNQDRNFAKTDENGNFSFRASNINDYFVYEVTFSDVDGEKNGSFEDKTITVTFNRDEGKKQGNWITNYNNNQEVKLTPKK